MRGFVLLALAFYGAHLSAAQASVQTGKTADGCSYKIINGQYLTSCPSKQKLETQPAAADQVTTQSYSASRPIGSYGDVPVRRNSAASAPSMQPQSQPMAAPVPSITSSIERENYGSDPVEEDSRRNRLKNRLLDKTYAGLLLGASNMKNSNSGSALGFGLNLGTNIDDHFGVELGYGYAKQDLRLGLAARGSNVDQGVPSTSSSDAALSSHLLHAELQAHLTDPLKRLRPYVGAGLGWRSATLTESRTSPNQQLGTPGTGGGSLHQSAFGGLVAAGTKLRIAKAFHLGFVFRYFLPILRQDARIEEPASVAASGSDEQTTNNTKLSKGDDSLTGSSQYQVLGGVHYSF